MSSFALITDPNPDVAGSIASALEQRGYAVHTASTWHEALRLTLPAEVGLVVAHAEHPSEGEGPIWLESVLRRFPRSALVITSRRQGQPGLIDGRCVYLAKPFGIDALIRAISVAEVLVDEPVLSVPGTLTSSPNVVGFEVPVRDLQGDQPPPIVLLLGGTPTPDWVSAFEKAVAAAEGFLAQASAVIHGDRVLLFSGNANARLVTQEIRKVVRAVSEQVHVNLMREAGAGPKSPAKTSFDRR